MLLHCSAPCSMLYAALCFQRTPFFLHLYHARFFQLLKSKSVLNTEYNPLRIYRAQRFANWCLGLLVWQHSGHHVCSSWERLQIKRGVFASNVENGGSRRKLPTGTGCFHRWHRERIRPPTADRVTLAEGEYGVANYSHPVQAINNPPNSPGCKIGGCSPQLPCAGANPRVKLGYEQKQISFTLRLRSELLVVPLAVMLLAPCNRQSWELFQHGASIVVDKTVLLSSCTA